jgi:hypothetical protein
MSAGIGERDGKMSDDAGNTKDIAVLNVKQEYTDDNIKRLEVAMLKIGDDVAEIKKAITMAGGVKIALITIGSVLAFVLHEVWNYLNLKSNFP